MRADALVDAAISSIPELTPVVARDLRALVATLLDGAPDAAIVLGGSVASARYGPPRRDRNHDIDLFVIARTRRAALRTLRSRDLRRALEALPLAAAAELVVLWEALVRSGRTSVYGRVLVGDPGLAAAIAGSPAPPQANLLRTAYLYLLESLLEPDDGDRLVAKALLTAFRAWLRPRQPADLAMRDLFAVDATAAALDAARGVLDADAAAAVAAALAWQSGDDGAWDARRAQRSARTFIRTIDGDGRRARPLRRLVRHAAARLHLGASPFHLVDSDRGFLDASAALLAAATAIESDDRDPASPRGGSALCGAEDLVRRLTGMRIGDAETAGARVRFTPRDRLERAAFALVAYGRYYPHKILLPAPPRVPSPACDEAGAEVVSIVVPCRNAAATVPRLLASVASQEIPPGYAVETIVADDGSADDSAMVAARGGATVVSSTRRGASAARNAGAARARGATIVFLDADTRIVGRDFLHHVLRAFARHPDVGVVGAAIECEEPTTAWGRADHMVSFFNWQPSQVPEKRHFHPSAALAVRRGLWTATGGFDVAIRRFHDFDFCRRARELGAAVYFEPAARVAHRPRETMRDALVHAARWGSNVRRVYAPYDVRRWWFLDRPVLFAANVPFEVVNRLWIVVKRWSWRRPRDTATLLPLAAALLGAWGAGVAIGGYRSITAVRAGAAIAAAREAERRGRNDWSSAE